MADRRPHDPTPFAPERDAATAHLPEGAPTRGWRRLDRLVLVVVAIGMLVPAGMLAAGLRPRPLENRPLATLPPLTVVGLLDASWFEGADRYLAENLWVRTIALRARAEAYLRTGGTGNPEVILGRDGWLFARGSFAPNCRNTAAGLAASLAAGAEALAARGITFRFVGIPDKQTIYPEQVGTHPFPPSCAELGRAELRAGIAALGPAGIDGWRYLLDARAANPGEPLYYRWDTHWTPVGALQVVRPLLESLGPGLWSESDVRIDGVRRRPADLASQVGLQRSERTPRVVLRPGADVGRSTVPVPVDLQNAPEVFRTTVQGQAPVVEGRTLVVYDSYFRIDLPLLTPYFADATWVHIGDMQRHPELFGLLGPFNTVIVERVERFLYGDNLDRLFGAMTGP